MKIETLPATVHRDARPPGIVIDTIVVHSMANLGSAAPEGLESCAECLAAHGVSAHYFIARSGLVGCLVPPEERAWHAGASRMPAPDGRERLNDFSIGIELLALPETDFSNEQYTALADLAAETAQRFPIRFVVGHADVAQPPGRKSDPGAAFRWDYAMALIRKKRPELEFPAQR